METASIFIVHPTNNEQIKALKAFVKALKIKFEITDSTNYNPDFVAKIEKGRQEYKDGEGTQISLNEIDNLWK